MVEMRNRTLLVALAILALGLIGTGLSALYERQEFIVTNFPMGTSEVSYGFPLGWHGYSFRWTGIPWGIPPLIYWFSLESLLLDAAFWVAISFFGSLAAIKSARALNLMATSRASVLGVKTSIMLLVMSLFFIAIGVGLCLIARPYLDLGLRLIGSGTAVLVATSSMMLRKPSNVRTREQYRDAANSHEV
jgi:hypothetical protein